MALYALGSNGNGQLGLGHRDDVSVPQPSLFASPPAPLHIHATASGGNHTLILAGPRNSPRLYCAGLTTTGACGLNSPAESVPKFRPVMLFLTDKVPTEEKDLGAGIPTHIAATWEASVVVMDFQRVYTLGVGSKGELGLGGLPAEILRSASATRIPEFPPEGSKVVDLTASMAHVVIVLDDGRVFGWGNGRKGQIGEPVDGNIKRPRQVNLPSNFHAVRAVAGKEFTILLDAENRVRVLGGDKWDIKAKAPETLSECIDIRAGWGNVIALHANGQVTAWGRNDHGQLPPANIPLIERIAVGSEHVVCLTKDTQNVISWGWGEHGNCGPNADEKGDVKGTYNVIASHENIPKELEIAGIAAGCATSWINIIPVTP